MLNELKEYEEYTKNSFSETNRIKYSNLRKGEIGGITRILGVIARHFLFHESTSNEDLSKRIICSVEALKSWCGYNYCEKCEKCDFQKIKNEIDDLKNWINNYLKHLRNDADENKKEKIDLCIKKLMTKNKQLSQSLFSRQISKQETNTDSNSLKKLTYEGIIADALVAGKLENFFLLANAFSNKNVNGKEILINNIYKYSTSKRKGEKIEKVEKVKFAKSSGELSADADALLKILSWYIKNRKSQLFTYYNGADINNWVINDRFDNLLNFYYSTEELKLENVEKGNAIPLFSSVLIGGNISKISVYPEWISLLGFKVISDAEWEEDCNKSKFILIEDMGGGKPLEIHIPEKE